MKNKLFILFKNNLINTYRLKKTSNKKMILILIGALYIIGSLLTTLYMLLNTIFDTVSKIGMTNYYLSLLMILSMLFSFFFTIFSAKSVLFDCKDNDLLFSLPIKKSTIFSSRLLVLLFMNFIIELLFIAPGLYIYISHVSVVPIFYLIIAMMLVLLPIIPTVLATFFGYIVAKITAFSKRKNVVEIICYILFIGLYMLFMAKGNSLLTLFTNNPEQITNIIKYIFYPNYLIERAITTNNVLYLLGFILINVIIIVLFILIFSKNYFNILSRLSSHVQTSDYKPKSLIASSQQKALNKKELKRYFASAIYVFNTIFGVAMFLIGAVASLFYDPKALAGLVTEAELSAFSLVLYFMMIAIGFTMTTNSSISIERNNFWVLKMLPIDVKQVFSAKKFVNKIIVIPAVILGLIIFCLNSYITVFQLIMLVLICIVYNAVICNFGLICNLLFPKLDAVNDTVIVKQSAASMMGIMIPLILMVSMIAIISTLTLTDISVLLIILAISIIFCVLSNVILYTWGIKKFKEIN